MSKLLIVDDEPAICNSLFFALMDKFTIYEAYNAESALRIMTAEKIDLVLLDMKLGKSNGLEVLLDIKAINPDTQVIIMTAYGTIESAVEAMRRGAFYYITKPINLDELVFLLEKAREFICLNNKVKTLTDEVKIKNAGNMIGSSKKMLELYDLIDRIKDIDCNVLITGESGTGKELVARAIHYSGNRKNEPFLAVSCSAIPEHLLESELFGFKKGSFTGALEDRKGIIQSANNGTLFLDEIGDMSFNLQTKLLRVLQEKEIIPLGTNQAIKVDLRFIAATNRDLEKCIKEGVFREDLYYRLNVVHIRVPALRERKDDIPILIKHFLNKYSTKFEKNIQGISKRAISLLENYNFPGNVRELENIIERAVALTQNNKINEEDLPEEVFKDQINISNQLVPVFVGDSIKKAEEKLIKATYQKLNGNKKKTAEILGISERTLHYKLKELEKNIEIISD